MSWSFQLQKVNQSFETIAAWYHEFMHRTEMCFRAMNQRLVRLEQHQGPTDEQLERVLRKILAEKFSDSNNRQPQSSTIIKEEHFVQDPRERTMIKPIQFDVATLLVDPESVPSSSYTESFNMLQGKLQRYPDLGGQQQEEEEVEDEDYDVLRYNINHPRRSNGFQ